jgi:formylglycine-generating enzyme required for sulfatase activity
VEQKTAPVTSAAPPAVTPLEPQMVTIPAGKFWMGSSDGEVAELEQMRTDKDYRIWIRDETPHHEVDLAAYTIGRYPVTNAEFARFMEDGGYAKKEWWTEAGWQARERGNWIKPRDWDDKQMSDPSQPVVGISWYEAYAYCRWLAARTNAPYRLPTEAEWEKSARGKEGYRYPWGNHWEASRCNNSETGPGRTTPVGQYSPQGDSSYGVAEMVGQVWEWCSDRFSKYDELKGAFENPEGDEARIIRGGSWLNSSPAAVCRCAIRGKNSPVNRLNNWGFRVARSP